MRIRIYTPEERASFIEILKLARKRIVCHQSEYVCNAITHTRHPNAALLTTEITHRLEGYYTVFAWLKNQGVFNGIEYPFDYWEPHSREYRLRWIDSLIEEFSRPF